MNHTEAEYSKLEEKLDIFKQKLRKFEILQYNPKELEIELNKGICNRVKLEKIEALWKRSEDGNINGRVFYDELKEILENP